MKRAKKTIAVIVIIFFILTFAGGNYFYNVALSSKSDKSDINSQDGKINHPSKEKQWFEKHAQNENIKYKNLNLAGYEFLHEDKKDLPFVICVHGYGGKAQNMTRFIKWFYDKGYNVFAMDLIAHGKSEGDYITMGGEDSKALVKWIDLLDEKYNSPRILLFGVSMGAATILNSLDENLPENVKAYIEDCGYLKLNDEFSYQMKKMYHLPKYPLIPASSLVTKLRAGYFFFDVDATEALKSTKLPGLIIHGGSDTYVPTENAYKIYDLAGGEKEILIVKDAVHAKSSLTDPKLYWDTVGAFLDKYFKVENGK